MTIWGGQSFRFRVYFGDGVPCRDVTARTAEGAKRTAIYAERVTGNKRRRLYVSRVEKLFEVGTRQPTFFPPEVPDAM